MASSEWAPYFNNPTPLLALEDLTRKPALLREPTGSRTTHPTRRCLCVHRWKFVIRKMPWPAITIAMFPKASSSAGGECFRAGTCNGIFKDRWVDGFKRGESNNRRHHMLRSMCSWSTKHPLADGDGRDATLVFRSVELRVGAGSFQVLVLAPLFTGLHEWRSSSANQAV